MYLRRKKSSTFSITGTWCIDGISLEDEKIILTDIQPHKLSDACISTSPLESETEESDSSESSYDDYRKDKAVSIRLGGVEALESSFCRSHSPFKHQVSEIEREYRKKLEYLKLKYGTIRDEKGWAIRSLTVKPKNTFTTEEAMKCVNICTGAPELSSSESDISMIYDCDPESDISMTYDCDPWMIDQFGLREVDARKQDDLFSENELTWISDWIREQKNDPDWDPAD